MRAAQYTFIPRSAAIMLFLLMGAAPITAAAEGQLEVQVGPPTTLATPPGGALAASGVTLSDGRALVAYWHPSCAGLLLTVVVVAVDGTVPSAPVDLYFSTGGPAGYSLAKDGSERAVIVWLEGTKAVAVSYDGVAFSSPVVLDFAGFDAWNCVADGASGAVKVACDTSDPLVPADVVQVRIGTFELGTLARSTPISLVPANAAGNHLSGFVLDGAGNAWVAYTTGTPASFGRNDLFLTALDANGTVTFAPFLLLGATNKTVIASMAPSPTDPGRVEVAFTEVENLPGNVEVQVRQASVGSATAPHPAIFSSSAALVTALAISNERVGSQSFLLLEWSEDRTADHDLTSGAAHPRPVFAALDEVLSVVVPMRVDPPAAGEGLVFASGGPVLELGASLRFQRVTLAFAATTLPNPSSVAPADLGIVTIVVVTAGSSTLVALSAVSERFRWVLLLAAWPLYVALRRDKVLLDNMRRGAIVQVVAETPGIRFTELSRRTGIASGVLRHHVAVLEEFGFVSRTSSRNAVRLYAAGKNPIREEPFREIRDQILAEIRKAPGLSHSELSRRVGVKWATILYHAEILEESGAIQTKRDGRTRRYWPAEPR